MVSLSNWIIISLINSIIHSFIEHWFSNCHIKLQQLASYGLVITYSSRMSVAILQMNHGTFLGEPATLVSWPWQYDHRWSCDRWKLRHLVIEGHDMPHGKHRTNNVVLRSMQETLWILCDCYCHCLEKDHSLEFGVNSFPTFKY